MITHQKLYHPLNYKTRLRLSRMHSPSDKYAFSIRYLLLTSVKICNHDQLKLVLGNSFAEEGDSDLVWVTDGDLVGEDFEVWESVGVEMADEDIVEVIVKTEIEAQSVIRFTFLISFERILIITNVRTYS